MESGMPGAYVAIAVLVAMGSIGVALSLREYRRHEEPIKTLARTLCESLVIFNFGTAVGVLLTVKYSRAFWVVMAISATLGYFILVLSALGAMKKLNATKKERKSSLMAPPAILIERPEEGIKLIQALHSYLRVPLLVISRRPPAEWENQTGIRPERFIWLSRVKTENSVDPLHLHIITEEITRFLQENPGGVVYIDGIEYLLFYNDFRSLAKFLTSIKDLAVLNGGHVVLSIAPCALKKSEVSMLRREFERVPIDAILRENLGRVLIGISPESVGDASGEGTAKSGGRGKEKTQEAQPLRRKEEAKERG